MGSVKAVLPRKLDSTHRNKNQISLLDPLIDIGTEKQILSAPLCDDFV